MNARWADAKTSSFCVALWLYFETHTCSSVLHTSDSVNVCQLCRINIARTHCIVDFSYFQMCGLSALLWPAVRCHQFNVIGYLYQKKSIAFSIPSIPSFNRCLGTLGDLLSGLINKWCSIYDVEVSCRIFFSVRIDFRRCIFCAPQQQQFGQCPSVLISNKLAKMPKTIFLSTLGMKEDAQCASLLSVHRFTISKTRTKEHQTRQKREREREWWKLFERHEWWSVRRKQSPKIGRVRRLLIPSRFNKSNIRSIS